MLPAARHPHPAGVCDRCCGRRDPGSLRAHHGRLPEHFAPALLVRGARGGSPVSVGAYLSKSRGTVIISSPPRGSSARRKFCSSTPSHPMSEQNSNAPYACQREPLELVVTSCLMPSASGGNRLTS